MNTLAPRLALFVALVTSAAAQGSLDLPIGSSGGTGTMDAPFSVPSMRLQVVYPLLGSSVRVFRQLGLRREGNLPNRVWGGQDPGEARMFNPLRITLGRGNVNAFGNDLTKNYISTPTQVFNRAISLPAAKDWPTFPMPWASAYVFPFQSAYTHLGTSDLIVDLSADRGSLANGKPWLIGSAYRMDGWGLRRTEWAWSTYYSKQGCPLMLQIGGRTGVTLYGVPAAAYLGIEKAPANTQFIVGVGAQGVRQASQGIPISTSCQPLMMQPLVTLSARTNSLGRFDIFLYRGVHLPAFTGVPIFAQAAYADPVNRSFQLTNSTELRMPNLPDLTIRARMRTASPASSSTAHTSLFHERGISIRLQ